MNRRSFLGTLSTGAFASTCGQTGQATITVEGASKGSPSRGIKTVLVTSAASELAQAVAAKLAAEGYTIRLTDQIQVATDHEFVLCTPDDNAATNRLVRGMDALVHVGEALPDASEAQQIDCLTRCTYNLLKAASAQGVSRLIYFNTLEVMTQYDESFAVGERFRPRPNCEPRILAKHLGEYTCREFAREGKLCITVFRIGIPDRNSPLWVDPRDVAQAVSQALKRPNMQPWPYTEEEGNWSIFHIQSGFSGARFGIGRARTVLGYEPRF